MLSACLAVFWVAIHCLLGVALPPESVLLQRLERIKTEMAKMRFCYNDSCFYRYLNVRFIPPDRATISAGIDRPSASPDQADYHFQFIDGRWQLLSGEEYTDVADFSFRGDRYEINGVHSSRVQKGDIYTARRQGNLRAGYVNLYFEILDEGKERIN
ncbi:MAG: hypothetical protein ACK4QL_00740 [Pseudanabaenaceae cyanobacterium]